MKLGLPFRVAPKAQRRTQLVRVVIPQRQFQVVTFDLDLSVIMKATTFTLMIGCPSSCDFLPWIQ